MKVKTSFTAFTMTMFAVLSSGCSSHPHEETDMHKESEEYVEGSDIHFSHEQAQAVGLQTEIVKPQAFSAVIPTSGQVQTQQGDERTIVATADGVVYFRNPSITEGEAVKNGEVLVTISSKALQDGDPIAKLKAAYDAAEKEFRRAEKLVGDRIISEKAFEEARMNYETAKAAYTGVAGRMTPKGINVSAPISGYIKNRLVNNGEYVAVGQPIAVVAQNKRLQLRADVAEKHFGQLRDIRTANFKMAYGDTIYSLEQMNGRLLSYGKSATDGSPYIPVTFEFDNVGDVLPGAFASVWLIAGVKNDVITVPVSALTEEQGVFFVYLQEADEVFRKQEVAVGQSNGMRTEILKGLKSGDTIVAKGAYMVRLASVSKAIPGHNHNH
ncbi:MAG: efflux RND transporter periplasmic adaptor subunit [Prevotella sp.]|nr:efflux RND transporter periplasmic adaptor subunit [Prevotella sp.]